ncbi:MAG: hypothetical protein R3E95_16110 [Thiolinea sp.]
MDAEGKKSEIKGNSNIVARGVLCDRGKQIGKVDHVDQLLDLHEISSCTIGHDSRPKIQKQNEDQLEKQREKVLNDGGVLSVHLHNSDGLHLLEDTVNEFKKKGGTFVYLDQLKGCGVFGK